ncbi:SDR family NAD(P)-dependent oxidoreductase [Curtobacterium aurantiacum]|uniref:SDR family NAD(P)-dependent oxidoreductase n=1 Tax=Curtobacterium aurantiacum TaxID=3236919 RepID=UPI00203266C6|nr:SDR family NAD(P)-dependent oxidoreductase [Curtobacterium flaccumfaciens]
MTASSTFLITGTSRGMGTDFARAALDAGHRVVATGRDPERVRAVLGDHERRLAVPLDVTDPESARAAVDAATDRFGGVDVLVNNACGSPPARTAWRGSCRRDSSSSSRRRRSPSCRRRSTWMRDGCPLPTSATGISL